MLVAASLMPLTKVDAQIDTLKLLTDVFRYLDDTNDKEKIAEVESFLIKRKEFYQQQKQDSAYIEALQNLISFYKYTDNKEAWYHEIKTYIDFDKYDNEIKKITERGCWNTSFIGRLRTDKWTHLLHLIEYYISRRDIEMATYYMYLVTGKYHCKFWCSAGSNPTHIYRHYLKLKEYGEREMSFDSLLIRTFHYCTAKQGFLHEDISKMVINSIKKHDKVELAREQKQNLCIVKTKEDENSQCPIFYVEFCGITLHFPKLLVRKKYSYELEKSGLQTPDETLISTIRTFYESKMKESFLMKELEKL